MQSIRHPVAQDRRGGESLFDSWRGQGTVLVVDDEPAIRQVAQCMLECMGFDVLTAGDGPQGVQVLAKHAAEVRAVVLDQSMPGPSGQETLGQMLHVRPDLKVILASGYGRRAALDGSPEPAGYLAKPFDFDTLAAKLKTVLR
jgi:DNA-binding NtrC family response regulator